MSIRIPIRTIIRTAGSFRVCRWCNCWIDHPQHKAKTHCPCPCHTEDVEYYEGKSP